jgi:hypothetical protein
MDSLIGGENWTIDPSQITDKFYHFLTQGYSFHNMYLEREYLFIMRHIKMQHFQQTYLIRTHFDSPFEFDPPTMLTLLKKCFNGYGYAD